MYTLIIASCFMGFFALYNTSKKAKLSGMGRIEKWLQTHPAAARQTGISLIVISIIAFLWKDGWGVGAFTASLLIMAIGSLVIAIAPLYYVTARHIALFVAIGWILELVIF